MDIKEYPEQSQIEKNDDMSVEDILKTIKKHIFQDYCNNSNLSDDHYIQDNHSYLSNIIDDYINKKENIIVLHNPILKRESLDKNFYRYDKKISILNIRSTKQKESLIPFSNIKNVPKQNLFIKIIIKILEPILENFIDKSLDYMINNQSSKKIRIKC